MKKIKFSLIIFILIINLFSCSSDNENRNNEINPLLIGEWNPTEVTVGGIPFSVLNECERNQVMRLTINKEILRKHWDGNFPCGYFDSSHTYDYVNNDFIIYTQINYNGENMLWRGENKILILNDSILKYELYRTNIDNTIIPEDERLTYFYKRKN